ncbi:Synaptic vesicle membrane protein VAT-1 like protein [Argiope bruennichi]|uniref:Synaptic vesicle membrane protein VAT-1 like protein n=1 Tax=Argiope bruennichi TaxID=94029 RepID=A0A8T0FZ82_ARGBR|nr:Synaptic vesicle membrane protein VAT-1 like protein [Argiope bruennichi]
MEEENKPASNEVVEDKNDTAPKEKTENEVKEAAEAIEEQAPPAKEMKCVVLSSFGGLKSIKIQNKPEPTPGEGEVLIRVKACGLNFLDVMLRQGVIDNPPKLPVIMGYECAGEIEAVGEGVPDVQVGDRVAAFSDGKAWAELVVVSTKFVYKLPPEMTFQDAAAMLMNFVVAYGLVFDTACIRENQTVLIHSAGGGVGLAVAQLIKTIPNVTLIGTASKHKHEAIKNYYSHLIERGADYVQEVKKLAPSGVDIVLDCLCGEDSKKGYDLLKPMGRYILYGTFQQDGDCKMRKSQLFTMANKLLILLMFRIPEAMQVLQERKNIGKITIDPAMEPKPKPVVESKKRKDSVKADKKSEDKAKKTEPTQKVEEDKDTPAEAS